MNIPTIVAKTEIGPVCPICGHDFEKPGVNLVACSCGYRREATEFETYYREMLLQRSIRRSLEGREKKSDINRLLLA